MQQCMSCMFYLKTLDCNEVKDKCGYAASEKQKGNVAVLVQGQRVSDIWKLSFDSLRVV